MTRAIPVPLAAEFHAFGRGLLSRARGTPFAHRASALNGGFDCTGLLRWWFASLGAPLSQPPELATYPANYYENPNGTLLLRLEEQFVAIPASAAQFGDVVAFRPRSGIADAAHVGILDDASRGVFWHAFRARGVTTNLLTERYWAEHLFGYLRFERFETLNARRRTVPTAVVAGQQ